MNLERLQKTIEEIGTSLPPEGDWMPALILEKPEDVSIFGFVGDAMKNDYTKSRTAEQMIELICEFKPHTACFVTTAWTLDWEGIPNRDERLKGFMDGTLRVSQQPDRIEIVSAYCYGEKGENEGEVLMMGYIQRFKDKHPKIKRWKIMGGQDDVSAGGRFPEAIKKGFMANRLGS
jgi:hypothetical protein